jgi:hypothetical protein
MSLSPLAWRSAAIFTVVGFAEVLLHELGHAVTAIALGAHPVVLLPGAVHSSNLPDAKLVLVAAAGPAFSLVLAIAGGLAWRKLPAHGDARVAAAWFTFHAFIGSLGYLILTPFSANDLGGLALYFGLPPIGRWLMFGAGVYAMTKISTALLPALAALAPSGDLLATPEARGRYVVRIAVVPWLVMLGASLVQDLPVDNVFILAPAVASGIPLVSAVSDARKRTDLKASGRPWPEQKPWVWIAAGVAFVLFNRLVLHPGLTLAP